MDRPALVDAHSHSRPDEIAVRHLGLDLTVDFDERRLSGPPRSTWGGPRQRGRVGTFSCRTSPGHDNLVT